MLSPDIFALGGRDNISEGSTRRLGCEMKQVVEIRTRYLQSACDAEYRKGRVNVPKRR